MNREILRFVDSIHRDRQVDKEIIFSGIEQALVSAAQKKYMSAERIEVHIDRVTGEIDASVEGETLSPNELGRIAALSGKQVLLQKIREAEREVIHAEYVPKIGQMMNGTIQARKGGGVLIVSLGKVEGIIPRSEQSQAENFSEGDRIKFILAEVNLQPSRVQMVCSRASPDLVRRLFELEIPEVGDGVVEIKAVAREAGFRTKIAVATNDPNVDCVGACVGVKGSRIRNIVDELFGEKIDIVRWNDTIEFLIVEALRPAEISSLELDFDTMSAVVYVKAEQQSLAIGRRGQNVRLAGKLTGWELNITPISEEELGGMRREDMESRAEGLFTDRLAKIEKAEAAAADQHEDGKLDALIGKAEESEETQAVPAEPALAPSEAAFDQALKNALAKATDEDPGAEVVDPLAAAGLGPPPPSSGEDADAAVGELDHEAEGSPEVEVSGTSQNGDFALETLPGVGKVTAGRLRGAGLDSPGAILNGGLERLAAIAGIGESRAQSILEYLQALPGSSQKSGE